MNCDSAHFSRGWPRVEISPENGLNGSTKHWENSNDTTFFLGVLKFFCCWVVRSENVFWDYFFEQHRDLGTKVYDQIIFGGPYQLTLILLQKWCLPTRLPSKLSAFMQSLGQLPPEKGTVDDGWIVWIGHLMFGNAPKK